MIELPTDLATVLDARNRALMDEHGLRDLRSCTGPES